MQKWLLTARSGVVLRCIKTVCNRGISKQEDANRGSHLFGSFKALSFFFFFFMFSQMWTLHTATLDLIKSIKSCCDSQRAHRWKSPVVAWWWRCVAFWAWQSHCSFASVFNSMFIKYRYTKAVCIDYSLVEHIYFKHFEKSEGKKKPQCEMILPISVMSFIFKCQAAPQFLHLPPSSRPVNV